MRAARRRQLALVRRMRGQWDVVASTRRPEADDPSPRAHRAATHPGSGHRGLLPRLETRVSDERTSDASRARGDWARARGQAARCRVVAKERVCERSKTRCERARPHRRITCCRLLLAGARPALPETDGPPQRCCWTRRARHPLDSLAGALRALAASLLCGHRPPARLVHLHRRGDARLVSTS